MNSVSKMTCCHCYVWAIHSCIFDTWGSVLLHSVTFFSLCTFHTEKFKNNIYVKHESWEHQTMVSQFKSPVGFFFNIKTKQYLTGHWNCSLNVSFKTTECLNLLLVKELLHRKWWNQMGWGLATFMTKCIDLHCQHTNHGTNIYAA